MICKDCNENKDVESFPKRKGSKSGYRNKCKKCTNEYHKKKKYTYTKTESQKQYQIDYHKKYYNNNKDILSIKNKKYYRDNKEKIKLRVKENYDKDYQSEYNKKYRKENIEYFRLYRLEYERIKMKNDLYRLKSGIRSLINSSIKNKGYSKNSKTQEILGCIIPLSSAKSEEEILKLNHYTNIQPLCSYNNRYIKKGKL